jgi:hypothetical protein
MAVAAGGIKPAGQVATLMNEWRAEGKTLRAIAHDLNRLNIRPRGRKRYASGVRNQLAPKR